MRLFGSGDLEETHRRGLACRHAARSCDVAGRMLHFGAALGMGDRLCEGEKSRCQGLTSGMNCTDTGEFFLIAKRNNSLSSAGRAVVFGSLVALSFAISLAFAFQGAWLVLPFAGAEMLVLFLAFRVIDRHAADFESIAIRGDRVLI